MTILTAKGLASSKPTGVNTDPPKATPNSPPLPESCPVAARAKPGPKTDPSAPHNAKIRSEAQKLFDEGNTIVAGGGGKEKLVPTPGGIKDGRRPDILYKSPGGELRGRNVGKTNSDGSPVKREQEALQDLNGPGGLPTDFVPYDR